MKKYKSMHLPHIHVVSHTHWDRAWYLTFEQTRARLLPMMDALLDLLKRDAGFKHFVLDGHLAMVLDYLELRPERRQDISHWAQQGRLLLGPFFVLPDLFIPSLESLVRNLRLGHALARQLGPVHKFGYLPDSFGHPAQLPQILAGFDIEGMWFSRGAGEESEKFGADFIWMAPDGTTVQATHQMGGGYANAIKLGQERPAAKQIVELVSEKMAPYCWHEQFLLNNGSDLQPAQENLSSILAQAQQHLPSTKIKHTTPLAYQQAVQLAAKRLRRKLPTFQGELRGSRYANILSGVLSARADLKLAHHEAETLLLKWTEPWAAITHYLGVKKFDPAPLAWAWRQLLLCQPHDDICGCSIDEVHEDDRRRLAHVQQIGETIVEENLHCLAAKVGAPYLAISAQPFVTRQLLYLRGAPAFRTENVPLLCQPCAEGALALVDIPALGFRALYPSSPRPKAASPIRLKESKQELLVENGLMALQINRRGEIVVKEQPTGKIFVEKLHLLDEGDAGDTYDFAPVKNDRPLDTANFPLRWRILERGPCRAVIELKWNMRLPLGLDASHQRRQRATKKMSLTLRLMLVAQSPLLEMEVEFENLVDDHRLRLAAVVPEKFRASYAGAPGEMRRRKIETGANRAAKKWHQPPAATLPFQDVVGLENRRGGVAIFAPGLREYEPAFVSPKSTQLLVTLLRSVRWLSRDDLSTRKGEAGPVWPVEGARQRGPQLVRLGLFVHRGSAIAAGVWRYAATHAAPARVITLGETSLGESSLGEISLGETSLDENSLGENSLGERFVKAAQFFRVEPSAVQLAALLVHPEQGWEIRLVNLSDKPVVAQLDCPFSRARQLKLSGELKSQRLLSPRRLPLRAHEIASFQLLGNGD